MMIELAVGIVNRQQHLFWQQPCLCMSIIWYLIYMMYTDVTICYAVLDPYFFDIQSN